MNHLFSLVIAQSSPDARLPNAGQPLLQASPDTSAVFPQAPGIGDVLNGYLFVFIIAFGATLLATPLVRRVAIRAGVVDWPDAVRKGHANPTPYLGGVAVFVGLLAGVVSSYFINGYQPGLAIVPFNVTLALVVIMFTGLLDDIFKWDPHWKLGGQLFAAAALALDEQVGYKVAEGLLRPFEGAMGSLIGQGAFSFHHLDLMPGSGVLEIDLIRWGGAIIIGLFVVGGCNSANLIDGLDGLLTGVTAIMAACLLAISVYLAVQNYGELTGARVVMSFALLGAALGFLPYNFKPAVIFLGDAGSLLIGFSVIVLILMLGEEGRTHYVFAGLIVFGLPILDTSLAIIRRKLNRLPISAPDANHLHHMLKRTSLGVVGAVFTLYAIAVAFGLIGIVLVFARARWVYAVVLVFGSFIVVTGIKVAQRARAQAEIEAMKRAAPTSLDPAPRHALPTPRTDAGVGSSAPAMGISATGGGK